MPNDVKVTIDLDQPEPILDIRLCPGEAVSFKVRHGSAQLLIPVPQLEVERRSESPAPSEEFVSFTVAKGQPVTLTVPSSFLPPIEGLEVGYSVLLFDGEAFSYGHGPHSPPRMIVVRG